MADEQERDPAGEDHEVSEAPPDTLPDDVSDEALAETPRPRIAGSAVRAATSATASDAASDEGADSDVEAPEGDAGEVDDGASTDESDDEAVLDEAVPDEEELGEDDLAWRALPLPTRLEALLFAATQPLSLRRLQSLAGDADAADVREALEELAGHYDGTSRAFGLEEIGGGFQLRTRAEVSGLLARLGRRRSTEKLSAAALETLAIVAYRQPVLRVDVEKIRGVASGEVLRTLVEKGMVRIAGRADLPGAPLLYGTTPSFLELFGLRSLRDLPTDRELLRAP